MTTFKHPDGEPARTGPSRGSLVSRAARQVKRRSGWLVLGPLVLLRFVFGSWVISAVDRYVAQRYLPGHRWLGGLLGAVAWLACAHAVGFALAIPTPLRPGDWGAIMIFGGLATMFAIQQFQITFHNETDQPLSVSFASEDGRSASLDLPAGEQRPVVVVSDGHIETMVFEDKASSVSFGRDISFRWFRPQCRTVRIVPSGSGGYLAVGPEQHQVAETGGRPGHTARVTTALRRRDGEPARSRPPQQSLVSRAAHHVAGKRDWLVFAPVLLLWFVFGFWIDYLAKRCVPRRRWLRIVLCTIGLFAHVLAIAIPLEALLGPPQFGFVVVEVVLGRLLLPFARGPFEIAFRNESSQPLFVSLAPGVWPRRAFELPAAGERSLLAVRGAGSLAMGFEDRASDVSYEWDIPFRWFRSRYRTVRIVPTGPSGEYAIDATA